MMGAPKVARSSDYAILIIDKINKASARWNTEERPTERAKGVNDRESYLFVIKSNSRFKRLTRTA